jgi:Zn-dependent protease with chaperone function
MPDLKGQLFAPDGTLQGTVSLEWDETAAVLRIRGEGIDREVPGASVSVSTGGWQDQAVLLTWPQEGAAATVGISERETVRALAGLISASLARELDRAIQVSLKRERRGRRTLAIAGLIALLPLALLAALFLLRGAILDAVLSRLPATVDAQVGSFAFDGLARSGGVVATGTASDAVQAIGARLARAAPESPYAFRFVVVRDPSVNAFAAPGGLIVVDTGLLAAAASPDEAAGVLAHEMTHVLRRHTLRQIAFRSGMIASVRLLFGAPEGAAEILSDSALDLTTLRFSREQELEADRGALELLARAHLRQDGLGRFLERLEREGDGPPAWLSSHPAAGERAAALAAALAPAQAPPRGESPSAAAPVESLDLDWWAVQAEATAQGSGHRDQSPNWR